MKVTIKSAEEIEKMRRAGEILAAVHQNLAREIKPGMSTLDIDRLGEEMIRGYGCIPSFLDYNGYPASICVSVNDEVVHGIPSEHRIIREGDIVSLDAGVIYEGYHSDAARTVAVGEVSEEAKLLIERTRQSFIEGMKKAYQDHQLDFDEKTQVINTSTHYEESYTQFVEHFRNHKHDLVFASYDKEGVAVVNAAIDNNISIPDDMEVMAMMDTSYSLICRPSLSTIHLPIYDMGALAVRLLTKILNQEELETKEVCVGYTNIYRKSTIQ